MMDTDLLLDGAPLTFGDEADNAAAAGSQDNGNAGTEFEIQDMSSMGGEEEEVVLIKKKQSEFRGENLCITKREMEDVQMESGKNNAYDNAIAVKAAIKGIFTGEVEKNESDVRDLIDQVLTDEAPTLKSDELRRDLLAQNILRYAKCEKRTPEILEPEQKDIILAEYSISVKPDVIFVRRNSKGEPIEFEAVLYKAGYPTVTQGGSKRDKCVEKCTELHLLIQYLKTLVPAGLSCKLIAGYYFMRQSTDSTNRNPDFFNGNNVVTLEDQYTNDGLGSKTDVDIRLNQMIEEYATGRECDGEECENCMYNCMCNYVASPEVLEKKEVRKKEKVQYTDSQEAVINAKSGVLRVIAGAGAGKTECVAERFTRLVLDDLGLEAD